MFSRLTKVFLISFCLIACNKKESSTGLPHTYTILGLHDIEFTSPSGNVLNLEMTPVPNYPQSLVTIKVDNLPEGINSSFDNISHGHGQPPFMSTIIFRCEKKIAAGNYNIKIKANDPLSDTIVKVVSLKVTEYNGWLFNGQVYELLSSEKDIASATMSIKSSSINRNSKLTFIFSGPGLPSPQSYRIVNTTSVGAGEVYVKYESEVAGIVDQYFGVAGGNIDLTLSNGKMKLVSEQIRLKNSNSAVFSIALDTSF